MPENNTIKLKLKKIKAAYKSEVKGIHLADAGRKEPPLHVVRL